MHILIVGSGFASVGAAYSAYERGIKTTLVVGRSGASALGCGVYDYTNSLTQRERLLLESQVQHAFKQIDVPIHLGERWVVSSIGTLRCSHAQDEQILSFETIEQGAQTPILIPDCPLHYWCAHSLAQSLQESFHSYGIPIPPIHTLPISLIQSHTEAQYSFADLASLHDSTDRCSWLIEQLRQMRVLAQTPSATLLLPPILGVHPSTIQRIRASLGPNIGETLCEPGGPSALRYAHWMRKAFQTMKINCIDGQVTSLSDFKAFIEPKHQPLSFDRVILATGGILGGGITFRSSEHEQAQEIPMHAQQSIHLGLRIECRQPTLLSHDDIAFAIDGSIVEATGSLFGGDPHSWLNQPMPNLMRVGVCVDETYRVLTRLNQPIDWLFAAGDLVTAQPHTALSAFVSGLRAGQHASCEHDFV